MIEDFIIPIFLPTLIGGALFSIGSIGFKIHPDFRLPAQEKHPARDALLVLLGSSTLLAFLFLANSQAASISEQRDYSPEDVAGQMIALGIVLLPLWVVMAIHKLGWRDLMFRRENLLSSIILGNMIGLIFFRLSGKLGFFGGILTERMLWAGLQYLVVAAGEETLFRGYIQVRWEKFLGSWAGWLATSIAFCLFHLPIQLITGKQPLASVGIELAQYLPLSLLLGYGVLKSRNIAMPVIVHFWINWIEAL